MGGIADYSGSLVLELPIREATFVAVQRDSRAVVRLVTLLQDVTLDTSCEITLKDLKRDQPDAYSVIRARLRTNPRRHWAGYAAGAFSVLMREIGCTFDEGARIVIHSNVPPGKGVSSSAALEVAAMNAISRAFDIKIDAQQLALLCQKVENLIVRAPSGVMDQMTASCGEAGTLLMLECQPANFITNLPVAEGVAFWGLDSGVRHSVAGNAYGAVRTAAFMGYRMIADAAGLAVRDFSTPGLAEIDDQRWRGYLANLSPSEFERDYAGRLPEVVSGSEFLARYRGTTDLVTRVDPERDYAVLSATSHPIYENERVGFFSELISPPAAEDRLVTAGELMYESHASYSRCGLGCPETDRIVELVKAAGPKAGLYGARITGGGSGGTVAILGREDTRTVVEDIARRYAEDTGLQPYIFEGSSEGAARAGCVKMRVDS